MKELKERTCIGCGRKGQKNEFVRMVARENHLLIDKDQSLDGRGIYLCPSLACMEKAKKRRAVNHRLKRNFPAQAMEDFFVLFSEYLRE